MTRLTIVNARVQTTTNLSHLDSVRADREDEPPGAAAQHRGVAAHGRRSRPVPIAATHLHLQPPAAIMEIATDVVRAIKRIRARVGDPTTERTRTVVASALFERNVLPTQLRVRLTVDPIRTG